jgi:hypothetical protein
MEEEKMKMEIVKTVNGIDITRYEGRKFPYFINIKEGNEWKEFFTFKTRKEAIEFAENYTK